MVVSVVWVEKNNGMTYNRGYDE